MYNETNCIDLLAVTTLQVCASDIYEWMFENINILYGSIQSAGGINQNAQEQNKDKYISKFKEVYPKDPECMLKVLQSLFPKFSWETGGYIHYDDSDDELRRYQKIACSVRSEYYFNLSLEDIKITKDQVLATINDYDLEELHDYFEELMQKETLRDYLNELRAYIAIIPKERLSLFFNELINLQTIELNYERKGSLEPIPAHTCKECMWIILRQLDNNSRLEMLISSINDADFRSLSILAAIVNNINSSNPNYRIIDETKMQGLEAVILDKIKSVSRKSNLLDTVNFESVYTLWRNLDLESCTDYIKDKLKCGQNVPKFLVNARNWTGMSSWTFNEECFSEFISKEEAYKKVLSLKGTNEFTLLDKDYKVIAITYYLWHDMNERDYKEISLEDIEMRLPEWEYGRS